MASRAAFLMVLLIGLASRSAGTPARLVEAGPAVRASRGGEAERFRIESAILGETRDVFVLLPPSYAESAGTRRFPVTVVLDGEVLTPAVAAVSEQLATKGQIPESVIVGVAGVQADDEVATSRKRVFDLTPPGMTVSGSSRQEGGDLFLDFLEHELLPALDARLRTAPPRILIGISSGGVLATYAAATRSAFQAVVSIDAPVGLDGGFLAQKLLARARAGGTAVRYASLETRFGWSDEEWRRLAAAAPPSWILHRERFAGEVHESVEMIAAYVGLRETFRDYSIVAVAELPPTDVLERYARVAESLGAPLLPPAKVLRRLLDDLLAESRGDLARQAYDLLMTGYGPVEDGAALEARIAAVERRPPPRETIEGLLATPFPSVDEASAFLGEWRGDVLMSPEQPRRGRTRLRVFVENGTVVGETVHPDAPPEHRVRRWQYLKITPSGMTWGLMNGMRPRALVLFEGKLDGDVLSGTTRFGGADFRQEDGTPPPPLTFSFEREPPASGTSS